MCCLNQKVVKTTTEVTVKGWRTWNLASNNQLVSPSQGCVWKSANLKSSGKPTSNNEHGFNVFKTQKAAQKKQGGMVFGQVEISDLIIHHSDGYRANKIKILSVSDPAVAEALGVKCCSTLSSANKARKKMGREAIAKPKARARAEKSKQVQSETVAVG